MRLIAIAYLLSIYRYLNAAPGNVTSEPSELMRKIMRTSWIKLNNTEFNPDTVLDTPQMIRRAGYRAEAHVIMTEDGYLLTLHRIPGGNDSLPVLIMHGMFSSSADWIVSGKDKALPYLLADQKYDVWLGNFRGNTYSRAHISLSPSDSKFWDFSFNEMGIYDLPAMITFITNMSSQPLHMYIGHSMGTTTFYIMASERPEIARMVQMMISLAPVAFVNHVRNPARNLALSWKIITLFSSNDEFLPHDDFMKFLLKYGCDQNSVEQKICADIIFIMLSGYDREQFNYTLLPVIEGHFPAGTSVKTVRHYAQEIQSGKFCKFDYDRATNLIIYNSEEPPDYNLTSIKVPVALFYSKNDLLADIEDVKRLALLLPNVVDMYEVPWPKFNHIDFLWAKDAPKLVYERIFKILNGENRNNITLVE